MAFMTKKPHTHLNEMFGHNDLTEDDFEKEEYIGFVLSVIDESHYLAMTVRPLESFRCVIEAYDILRPVDISELTEQERNIKEENFCLAPNVYHSQSEPQGETIAERCENRAREAMKAMFPDVRTGSVEIHDSVFKKDDLLTSLKDIPELFEIGEGKREEFDEFYDWFGKMLQEKHFKEYYTVIVAAYEDKEHPNEGCNWMVAVDLKLEEVSIMRNEQERTRFYRSLGPDFDMVYSQKLNGTYQVLQ